MCNPCFSKLPSQIYSFQFTKIVSSKQNAWSQILTPEVLFCTSSFLSEWFSNTRKSSYFQAHSAVVTKSCFWRFDSLTQALLVLFGLPCCLALLGPLLQTEDATFLLLCLSSTCLVGVLKHCLLLVGLVKTLSFLHDLWLDRSMKHIHGLWAFCISLYNCWGLVF